MDETPEKIRDYRDLIVWQEAMDIAEAIYVVTRGFPCEEMYGMAAQMRRCSASIPANIAEGFGRAQRRPFIQFLRIAQGSLKKVGAARGSGTTIFFRPDPKIFPSVKFDAKRIAEQLEAKAYLHSALTIYFIDEAAGTKHSDHYAEGLKTFLAKIIEEAELPPGVVNIVTGAGETGAAVASH